MLCLKCQTLMSKANYNGVLVDYCPKCKSFWLDKGEFNKIKHNKKNDKDKIKKEAIKEKKNDPLVYVGNSCPKCFGELHIYYEGKIPLDRCERCEGIFFDRGELEECLKKTSNSFLNKIFKFFC